MFLLVHFLSIYNNISRFCLLLYIINNIIIIGDNMKKYIFLFSIVIVIGIVFIGSNMVTTKSFSNDKKAVDVPNITDDFEAEINSHLVFTNVDENNNVLNNSHFRLSTHDGKYKLQSYYINENGVSLYSVQDSRDLSFNNAWSLLTNSQKQKIESIKTFGDFYNVFKDNKNGSSNNYYFCSKYSDGFSTCYGYIGTYFLLEQTSVQSGYSKEKYIVPGVVYFDFKIDDPSDLDVDDFVTIPDNKKLTLEYIDFYTGLNLPIVPLLNYDNYDEVFNFTDYSEYEDFIMENMINSYYCPPNTGRRMINDLDGNSGGIIKKHTHFYEMQGLHNCLSMIINKRGSVNLNINTMVNERESVSTVSNSKVSYKVSIKNNSNITSYDNKVVSKLPDGFKYVEGSANNNGVYDPNTNTITWFLYRIDDNENVVLMYDAMTSGSLSSFKSYVGEAYVESSNSSRVISNRTSVRLMANPKTYAPIYGIGITLLITWCVAFYLYFDKRKREVLQ